MNIYNESDNETKVLNFKKGDNIMKQVLLLGDSIRMFYQKKVAEKLGEEYNVFGPQENCRFAAYTHNTLRHWLPTFPNPDIIHWNNGLWDTGHFYGEEENGTSLPVYLEYLERTAKILLSTGAKVFFATTTPVHPKRKVPMGEQRNPEIEMYNKAAVELMNRLGIEVNDLYPLIAEDFDGRLCDDLIHPSEKGIDVLSDAVCAKIRSVSIETAEVGEMLKGDTEEYYAQLKDIK